MRRGRIVPRVRHGICCEESEELKEERGRGKKEAGNQWGTPILYT